MWSATIGNTDGWEASASTIEPGSLQGQTWLSIVLAAIPVGNNPHSV
jgi:hypothetical protein